MGKRELVALFCLSSWCLVIVVWLFLTMPWVCLQFVIVVFPDHTHLLFLKVIRVSLRYEMSKLCLYISREGGRMFCLYSIYISFNALKYFHLFVE